MRQEAKGAKMELLNLGGSDESAAPTRSLGRFKKMGLGLALVAVAATVSTTLAGAININGGSNGTGSVTFGQGVATTAACDNSISVAPTSTYNVNSSTWYLKDLTVSGISQDCMGKRLTIGFYYNDGSYPMCTVNDFTVDFTTNAQTGWGYNDFSEPASLDFYDNGMIQAVTTDSTDNNSFILHDFQYGSYCGDTVESAPLTHITVESSEIPSSETRWYGSDWAKQHPAMTYTTRSGKGKLHA